MYADYMDYFMMAKRQLGEGLPRAACFFLGKASAFLNVAFGRNEIGKELYSRELEKIDDLFTECLTK